MTDFKMEARLKNIEDAITSIFLCLFSCADIDKEQISRMYTNFDKNIFDIRQNSYSYDIKVDNN